MDTREPPAGAGPVRARLTVEQRLRSAPVTLGLLAMCVVVFLLAERDGSTRDLVTLVNYGATQRGLVWSGEVWRLFTAMFLHIGGVHLAVNLFFGYEIASRAEAGLGSGRFLALYLGSGVAASSLSVIGQDAVSAGASGALFGVLGAGLVGWARAAGSLAGLWRQPAFRQQVAWLVMWAVVGEFLGFDNLAHLGGLLFGGVFMWAVKGSRLKLLAPAVLVVLLAVGASRPWPGVNAG